MIAERKEAPKIVAALSEAQDKATNPQLQELNLTLEETRSSIIVGQVPKAGKPL